MHSKCTVEQKKSQDIQPILNLSQEMWSCWPRTLGTGAPGLSLIKSALLRNLNKICFGSLTCNTDIYSNHLCKAIPDNIYWVGTYFSSDTNHMKTQFVSIYLLKFLLAGSKLFTQLGTFFFKSTPYFLELCCFTFFISQVFFFQNLEEK